MAQKNIEIKKENENRKKYITIENNYSSVLCMLELNQISYFEKEKKISLNLVAIGFSSAKIYLINLSTMEIYQIIKDSNSIYSLCQFNNNSKYLICSLSNGFISIYILKDKYYEIIQKMQKPLEIKKGSINKVITLSNGDLASADTGSITIWKQKIVNNNKIDEFELYKEIITDSDTCQLIEVNTNVFACAIYKDKLIRIFKNCNDYPLLGILRNVESHGKNSNGMAKINDRLFCLGGKNYFIYMVFVEPVQILQKIKLINEISLCIISCLNISNKGFLFASYGDNIIQFKIKKDARNNFIELEEFDKKNNYYSQSEAFITTNDGKLFYQINNNKMKFCLEQFKE